MLNDGNTARSGTAPSGTGFRGTAKHIIGKYELIEEIGRGGMGVVYRATDHSLRRTVAVKVLREEFHHQALIVSRFQREAKAAACLNHPNIVQIYSVGWLCGVLHIAMEHIEGQSLAQIMQIEHRIPWQRALAIADQVADSLACSHAHQIIHRDIKLTNILLDANEHAYVTDFGVAKILTAETQLTIRGERLGTPQYMAPERLSGTDATVASDLYSLGVVLFQLISGRLPHEGRSKAELIKRILSEPAARLRDYVPDVPEDVERLVAYLIERNPKDRPEDADTVRAAIARVQSGQCLDENQSALGSAVADFRDSMATPAPQAATPASTPRSTPAGLFQATTTWWRRQWRTVPKVARIAGWAILIPAAAYLSFTAASRIGALDGVQAIGRANSDVSRWSHDGVVADFSSDQPGALTATIHLPDFVVVATAWADNEAEFGVQASAWPGGSASAPGKGAGALIVTLDGRPNTPRAGQRALCALDPASKTAMLLVPPVPATWLNAGPRPAGPNSSTPAHPDTTWTVSSRADAFLPTVTLTNLSEASPKS